MKMMSVVKGKNTEDVAEGEVEKWRAKYKYVGELIDTKDFTVEELKQYDGLQGKGIYLAGMVLIKINSSRLPLFTLLSSIYINW